MNVHYVIVDAAGELLGGWPLQAQTPIYGDQIDLDAGRYEVIRRRWHLDQLGVRLQIVVQPVPLEEP